MPLNRDDSLGRRCPACCRRSSGIAAPRRGRRRTRSPGLRAATALGCALGRVRRAADRRRRAGAVPRRAARPHHRSAAARSAALSLAAIRRLRCRRLVRPGFRRRARADPGRGAGARRRTRPRRQYRDQGRRAAATYATAAAVADVAATGLARRAAGRCWCRAFTAGGLAAIARRWRRDIPRGLLFRIVPRGWAADRASGSAAPRSAPITAGLRPRPGRARSATPAIRCWPIRSTTRRGRGCCSPGG